MPRVNSFEQRAKTIKVKLNKIGVAATNWKYFFEFWIAPKKATNEIKNIYGKTSCKKLVAAKYFSGSSTIEHEATTSKINEEQLFYCNQRGLDQEEAVSLIVNRFFWFVSFYYFF